MLMKRLTAWLISLVLAVVVTFILFEFTSVAIPFIEGGLFTVLTILCFAVFFSIPIDIFLKADLFDEHGWHLGLFDLMGPLGKDDAAPPKDYKPIVSREQRMKQKKA
jgi:hypothetical protein